MAEYEAKQKETEALTQYLLNHMRKMFYGFGIDENILNTYYANKNIRTYDKMEKNVGRQKNYITMLVIVSIL